MSKFTVVTCTYGLEFLVKRKLEECQELTYILLCPSKGFYIESDEVQHLLKKKVYLIYKLSQGESTLRPFRSLVYTIDRLTLNLTLTLQMKKDGDDDQQEKCTICLSEFEMEEDVR